ncbi:hypothetical protein [Streptomyces sp. NPDC002172]
MLTSGVRSVMASVRHSANAITDAIVLRSAVASVYAQVKARFLYRCDVTFPTRFLTYFLARFVAYCIYNWPFRWSTSGTASFASRRADSWVTSGNTSGIATFHANMYRSVRPRLAVSGIGEGGVSDNATGRCRVCGIASQLV